MLRSDDRAGKLKATKNMKASDPHLESIVLRISTHDGNFVYQIAKLPRKDAECVGRLAASGRLEEQASDVFSMPLTLSEAMQQIETREYRVIDRDSVLQ